MSILELVAIANSLEITEESLQSLKDKLEADTEEVHVSNSWLAITYKI